MSRAPLLLDANASVPPLPAALRTMAEAAALGGNPSSPHALGRKVRRLLDEAREKVASALGGEPKEVVFLSGASEGNRFVVDALVARSAREGRPLAVVATPLEHPSLLKPLVAAGDAGRLDLRLAPLDASGDPDWGAARSDEWSELLANADALILTAAHNETGLVPDLDRVLPLLRDEALLVVDAAQAVGRLAAPPRSRADVVVASAHKLGGVPGAGAVLLRGRARGLGAGWLGGGQEGGLRPGTEATPAVVAFGAACDEIASTRAAHQLLASARHALEARLQAEFDDVTVLAQGRPRLPNTSCFSVGGVDGDALRMALDAALLLVGFGSACSALAPEPSPALLAMGLDRAQARATVRVSLAPPVDGEDAEQSQALVEEAAARLVEVIGRLRARAR